MPSPDFDPDIKSALCVVGNRETRLATYVGAHHFGRLGYHQMGLRLQEHFDLPVVTSVQGDFDRAFVPHGFGERIEEQLDNQRYPVISYGTRREESALPVIGEMYEWSSSSAIDLLTILGRTASSAHSGSRAPYNSYRILEAALRGENISDGDKRRAELRSRAERLVEYGILTHNDDANTFTIRDPHYRRRGARIATIIFYTTLQAAWDKDPSQYWGVDELLELSQGLFPSLTNDDKLVRKVRRHIVEAASNRYAAKHVGAINKIDFMDTSYNIAPKYTDDVADLVERIAKLGEAKRKFLTHATEKALAMYEAGPAAGKVIRKSFDAPRHG